MYLARENAGPRHYRYILRESYRDGAFYRSRDLADLGPDPGRCFVYSGETAFHLDETFLSDLQAQGLTATYAELEELLFPFLDPYLKQAPALSQPEKIPGLATGIGAAAATGHG